MSLPNGYVYKDGAYWGPDGAGPFVWDGVSLSLMPAGNAAAGYSQPLNRGLTLNGGQGITVNATTKQIALVPCAVYRVRCLANASIALYDALGATTNPILPTTAMTAGQTIEIGEITTIGLYAVASLADSFRVVTN